MSKTLETGRDYAAIFGLDTGNGAKMIYRGGNTWEMHNEAGESMTVEAPEATANATEYVNRPSVTMGHL